MAAPASPVPPARNSAGRGRHRHGEVSTAGRDRQSPQPMHGARWCPAEAPPDRTVRPGAAGNGAGPGRGQRIQAGRGSLTARAGACGTRKGSATGPGAALPTARSHPPGSHCQSRGSARQSPCPGPLPRPRPPCPALSSARHREMPAGDTRWCALPQGNLQRRCGTTARGTCTWSSVSRTART